MSERIVDVYPEETAERFQEVVRCRDCEHFESTGNCHYWAIYEPIHGGHEFMEVLGEVTFDGFCAWGERRES